jgi:hypothetical protein
MLDVRKRGDRIEFRLSEFAQATGQMWVGDAEIAVVTTTMSKAGYLGITVGKNGERRCRLTAAGRAQYDRMVADAQALREFFGPKPSDSGLERPQ